MTSIDRHDILKINKQVIKMMFTLCMFYVDVHNGMGF